MLLRKLPADSWDAVTSLRSLLFLQRRFKQSTSISGRKFGETLSRKKRKHKLGVTGEPLVPRKTGILFFSNQTNFVVLVAVLFIFSVFYFILSICREILLFVEVARLEVKLNVRINTY